MDDLPKDFVLEQMVVGDFSTVRLGRLDNRLVAIKTSDNKEIIRREIEVLDYVGYHSNIVTRVRKDTNRLILNGVRDGLNLERWIEGFGREEVGTCVRMLKEVAFALAYVHSKNVIHHDVSPCNVLVDTLQHPNRLILCDFGLSEIAPTGRGSERYLAKQSSSRYVAPEKKEGSLIPVTNKIDVYGFSYVIEYVLKRGRLEFEYEYHVPIRLLNLIEACRKKSPDERPTMEEVVKALFDPNLPLTETHETRVYTMFREMKKGKSEAISRKYTLYTLPLLSDYRKAEMERKLIAEEEKLERDGCPRVFLNVLGRVHLSFTDIIGREVLENFFYTWNPYEEMVEIWFADLGVGLFLDMSDREYFALKRIPYPEREEDRIIIDVMVRKNATAAGSMFFDFLTCKNQERKAVHFLIEMLKYCRECANEGKNREGRVVEEIYNSICALTL